MRLAVCSPSIPSRRLLGATSHRDNTLSTPISHRAESRLSLHPGLDGVAPVRLAPPAALGL